jgi:two-component system, OmpR family, phosphate regulon response regulator PhoB
VDDNHLIRRLLDLILEGAGYVPVEAESGEEALALAAEAEPDLCIVDEVMPGMLGSDVIRALRRSPDPRLARVPVIGISGREGAVRELLAAGATTFVPKPIDEQRILAAIAQTLSRPGWPPLAGMPAA